jgi:hypothetical protein
VGAERRIDTMSATQDEGQQYRAKAEELVQRAERDPAFAQQAKADPLGTLTAAGIPADAAQRMLQGNASAEAEVSGYMNCADTTCWSSECPATCTITLIAIHI